MLDPIHNQGLRLALGAFRTSPVASLYVEADEPSLYSRREKLSLQYAIRLERADLLALVCGVFCEFVTFPLVSWVRCGT